MRMIQPFLKSCLTTKLGCMEITKWKASAQGNGACNAIFKAFMREQTPQSVFMSNRHLFNSADIVAHLLGRLEHQFPRCVEYRRQQANIAHKQGYLRSAFGYERQFFNVIRRSRTGNGYDHASDYSNAVSFMARNHAACLIALAIMGLSAPGRQLIAPTENGCMLEVKNNDPLDLPPMPAVGVIVRPDGSEWRPTLAYRPLEQKKENVNE